MTVIVPGVHTQFFPAAATTPISIPFPGAEHKPILAERFKTKMCRNYETTGVCPYEARCMFAHGDAELRTKQMNLDDNLVTEDAIKAFQRNLFASIQHARQQEYFLASMASPSYQHQHFVHDAMSSSPVVATSPTGVDKSKPYRHDPYAERSGWSPLIKAFSTHSSPAHAFPSRKAAAGDACVILP